MTHVPIFSPIIVLFLICNNDTFAKAGNADNFSESRASHRANGCEHSDEGLFGSELQKSYQNGFTDILQIFQKMNQTIVDLNNRIDALEKDGARMRSFIQIKSGLEEKYKRKILQHPHAKLFIQDREIIHHIVVQTGKYETYDFNHSSHKGGCHSLSQRRFKSVDPQGTCIRIFSMDLCLGFSQAIYPGSSVDIDPKLNQVASVGPCARNEFEHAILEDTENCSCQKIVQKSEVHLKTFAAMPDKLGDFYSHYSPAFTSLVQSHPDSNNPVTYYLFREGRLEFIKGIIYPRHILSEDIARDRRSESRKLSFYQDISLNPETDEVGYAIPEVLGGPMDQRYNCFAQNKNQRRTYLSNIVPQITQFLADNPDKLVWLDLTLFYVSNSTRPSGIWYRIHKSVVDEITYDYWTN